MSGNLTCALEVDSQIEPLRRYANIFEIEFSISEVDLRFGQHFGDDHEPLVHSRLVTTPVHLATLAKALNGAIALYQHRFGPIPTGEPNGQES